MRVIVARENCEYYRKQLPEQASETKKRISDARKSDESPSRKSFAKVTPEEIAATRHMLRDAEAYLEQMLSAFQTQFPEYLDALNVIVRD